MAFTEVTDDQWIWKRKVKITDEMKEVLKMIETCRPGVTFEVTLNAPVKSFRTIIRRHFDGRKFINIKAKDSTLSAWYIRVDKNPQSGKAKRSKHQEAPITAPKTAASASLSNPA